MKQEIRSQIRAAIYRVPNKNHEAMVQTQKQFVEASENHIVKSANLSPAI